MIMAGATRDWGWEAGGMSKMKRDVIGHQRKRSRGDRHCVSVARTVHLSTRPDKVLLMRGPRRLIVRRLSWSLSDGPPRMRRAGDWGQRRRSPLAWSCVCNLVPRLEVLVGPEAANWGASVLRTESILNRVLIRTASKRACRETLYGFHVTNLYPA